MALRDYAEEDEESFYGQPFELQGKVSVWVSAMDLGELPDKIDILQDLCGVGYYNPDVQDVVIGEVEQPLARLLEAGISYQSSFREEVVNAAEAVNISQSKWILAQYDFAYDASVVERPIDQSIVFLGVFDYDQD